jgi:undecaprenyl diphosphate synthase
METVRKFQVESRWPRHVAVIMDGNGRWAKARNLPRIAGHRKGAEAVRELVRSCTELNIPFVTIYAFSSENWKRSPAEVSDLMSLLRLYLQRNVSDLHKEGVRIRFIGDRDRLDNGIKMMISGAESLTNDNQNLTVSIAVNYGSRREIVLAVRRIAEDVRSGNLDPDQVDEESFASYLDTAGIPDPDLLIRTSGEQRLSNFLLWQSAYTELVFVPTLWPDFDRKALLEAIGEFQRRDRRYGGLSA